MVVTCTYPTPELNGVGQVLRPGDRVALVLRVGSAPSRCHTGEVADVDEHGVRVTVRHWAVEETRAFDFFAPWSSITAALVASDDDDWEAFSEAAATFQERCRDLP